ncbi:HEAT repeat domain-containing protein [Streptomyces sp. NPDC093598]|uniref:HEAT repeat domain-containing protein n=1 Tax=Streptomyces sp. NPDC093598 TaxID=3366046 RepID=UPI0038178D97
MAGRTGAGVNEDIRGGEAAAARLAEGTPLDEVLDVADPAAWTGLDAGVRAWGWYGIRDLPDKAWVDGLDGAARSKALGIGRWVFRSSRWRAEAAHGPSVEPRLAVALCHPDGHTREAALARVADRPALLPLVVIRAADWAAPVRDRARELLRAGLDALNGIALAPLILRIGRRERGAYGVELLGALLRRAPHGPLSTLFIHPDRTVRRFAYRLAAEESLLSPARLARTAARDDDVVVQDLCAGAALAALREDGDFDDVLEPLLAARYPRARSAGVTALRRAGQPERALEFLADRSALVRACARYVVRQHGTDPLPWYRQRCAEADDPALPAGAVIGLAECGERSDAELLRPLLTHRVPTVRARAVAGLRTLDVTVVEELRPLLDDPAPGVVREATVALLPSAALLPQAWLAERLAAERPRHVRIAAHRLVAARGWVAGVPVGPGRRC